jgi:hypothetical protein
VLSDRIQQAFDINAPDLTYPPIVDYVRNAFHKRAVEIPSQLVPRVEPSPFHFLSGTNSITHPRVPIRALRFNRSYTFLAESAESAERIKCQLT